MRTLSLRAGVVVREKESTKISIPQCQVVARAKSKINQEIGEKVCGCNLEVGGGGLHGAGGGLNGVARLLSPAPGTKWCSIKIS